MTSNYHHPSISLNGRDVAINDIRSESAVSATDFEFATISFLKEWLNGSLSFRQNTSGSTGAPKEIVITREQMISSAWATAQALDLKQNDTALICLDTRFIAGKMMCVRSLVTGMKMIIKEPVANPLADLPLHVPVDLVALVPYQIEAILDSAASQWLNKIKTIIIGGAPLKSHVAQQLGAYASRCYLTYGMTETMSHIALHHIGGSDPEGVFQCLPGIEIEVDERGCLATSVPWIPEKVLTNDLIQIISSKKFRWIGRVDNMINTGGFKANPEKIEFQIEKVFKSLNVERRFFVTGIPDEQTGHRVALIVEGDELPDLFEKLQNRLKHLVQRFEIPRSIHFHEAFIFTANNKLDRSSTLHAFKSSQRLRKN